MLGTWPSSALLESTRPTTRVAAVITTMMIAACTCETHVHMDPVDGDDREHGFEDGHYVFYMIEGEQLTYRLGYYDDTSTYYPIEPTQIRSEDESVFTIEAWTPAVVEGGRAESVDDYATVTVRAHRAGEALIHFEMPDWEASERIVVVSSPEQIPYPDE